MLEEMNDWFITDGGKRWIRCRVIGNVLGGMVAVELYLRDEDGHHIREKGKARKASKEWGWGWLVEGK